MSGFFPRLPVRLTPRQRPRFGYAASALRQLRDRRFNGYAPLNFISGGSVRDESGVVLPDRTHSDSSARTDIILVGVNVAF